MPEIDFNPLHRNLQFPADIRQCGVCCALMPHGDIGDHATWHETLTTQTSKTAPESQPADWPPQPGDLWRSSRESYFGVDIADQDADQADIRLINTGGEAFDPDTIRECFGLTLVHREGATS